MYARAFLEGRIAEEQLPKLPDASWPPTGDCRPYPHPWLNARLLAVSDGVDGAWGRSWAIYHARFPQISRTTAVNL